MIQVDGEPSRFFHSVVLAAILIAPACYGQATAVAEVQGQVSDASGAAVPGAQIKITQVETRFGRKTTSAADGAYSFPNLPVGPYTLEVTARRLTYHKHVGLLLQDD